MVSKCLSCRTFAKPISSILNGQFYQLNEIIGHEGTFDLTIAIVILRLKGDLDGLG